jgi:hypothetical protein
MKHETTTFSYTRTLQLLHKHSALLDKESGEFKYRDDIVNPQFFMMLRMCYG